MVRGKNISTCEWSVEKMPKCKWSIEKNAHLWMVRGKTFPPVSGLWKNVISGWFVEKNAHLWMVRGKNISTCEWSVEKMLICEWSVEKMLTCEWSLEKKNPTGNGPWKNAHLWMAVGKKNSSIICTLTFPDQCIKVGSFKDYAKSGQIFVVAVWLDSIAVSVFAVILVDIDKHCISSWDDQACLGLIVWEISWSFNFRCSDCFLKSYWLLVVIGYREVLTLQETAVRLPKEFPHCSRILCFPYFRYCHNVLPFSRYLYSI